MTVVKDFCGTGFNFIDWFSEVALHPLAQFFLCLACTGRYDMPIFPNALTWHKPLG